MIDPSAPQPLPEDESPWIEDAEEELSTAAPTVAPVVPVSVRPVTRQMGPRPGAAPVLRDEGSGWAVAGFLLGGLTLLVIVFGGGYWGLSIAEFSAE